MNRYAKGIFYAVLLLLVTVALHEVGHLIVARQLISQEIEIRLFPSFLFGDVLGCLHIPESIGYQAWKGVLIAVSGPALSAVLMLIILLNTRKKSFLAALACFFGINQVSYSIVEPIRFLEIVPRWTMYLPLLAGGVGIISYAVYLKLSGLI